MQINKASSNKTWILLILFTGSTILYLSGNNDRVLINELIENSGDGAWNTEPKAVKDGNAIDLKADWDQRKKTTNSFLAFGTLLILLSIYLWCTSSENKKL